MFRDPVLDGLEAKALAASPTLAAALARYDEALAAARVDAREPLPLPSVDASASRAMYSANRQSEYPSTTFAYTTNSFDLPLVLSYEVDLFGAARRSVESARSLAEAQGATYQNVLLTLEAGVAQNYFTLRSLVSQRELLRRNVALLEDALDLVRKLRKGGANSDLDVYQAETELATVESTRGGERPRHRAAGARARRARGPEPRGLRARGRAARRARPRLSRRASRASSSSAGPTSRPRSARSPRRTRGSASPRRPSSLRSA